MESFFEIFEEHQETFLNFIACSIKAGVLYVLEFVSGMGWWTPHNIERLKKHTDGLHPLRWHGFLDIKRPLSF